MHWQREVIDLNGTHYNSSHSYEDFNLLRTAPKKISPPQIKSNLIDNPGGNGKIDLSTSHTGVPLYNDRIITESFMIPFAQKRSEHILSEIYRILDGAKAQIWFDEQPDYYWVGKPMVKNVDKSNDTHLKLDIESEVFPFKYERFSSLDDWEWDYLNFETGIIREYNDIYIDGECYVEIIGTKMPSIPKFYLSDVTADISVEYYDAALDRTALVNLSQKEDTSDIIIREGLCRLHFYGVGYVSIEYRGGIL